MSEPVTTDELLDAAEKRTGLARGQLLTMVAKSAAVRHVATKAEGGEGFVLKGGTLLTHVYGGSRQSIADADYVHLDPAAMTDDIEAALQVDEGSFTMETAVQVEAGGEGFLGRGVFSFDDIVIKRRKERELRITVSIRKGERLDDSGGKLEYIDPTLAGENRFLIEGLTLNELSAEKFLAWSSKDLAKHIVDLAYVGRDWCDTDKIAQESVADLVSKKFKAEGGSRRYVELGISRPSQLVRRFKDLDRMKTVLHDNWGQLSTDEIFFLPLEENKADDETLLDSANVERIALEAWAPLLDRLASGDYD